MSFIGPAFRTNVRTFKLPRRFATIAALAVISIIVLTDYYFLQSEKSKRSPVTTDNVASGPATSMADIQALDNVLPEPSKAPPSVKDHPVIADTKPFATTPEKTYEDVHNMTTVREMMKHAWSNYERYAWGKDELRPISKDSKNWIGNEGLAATLVDALDTLYIMGFREEFDKAKRFVLEKLDFDKDVYVSTFETNIRVLGGLIAAYDLSGDQALIAKARDIGDRLLRAFDTASGMPRSMVNLKTGHGKNHQWSSYGILSEVGTMQLEFTRLSFLTGDQKYAQKALAIIDAIDKKDIPIKGLYPYYLDTESGTFQGSSYSLGGLSDSFYEYLLKQWLLDNKSQPKFRRMYDASVKALRENLVKVSRDGHTYIANKPFNNLDNSMEHLTCFAGGMFGLGAVTKKDEGWKEVLELSEKVTETCYEMYHRSPLGISPEKMNIESWTIDVPYYILRPEVIESIFYMWRLTHNQKYRDWGFEIMNNIQKHCRVESGYSGIEDVTKKPPKLNNNMESFFLAETLKYLYLLFTDDSVISLDEFVFNTEAHPFRKNI